MNMRVVDGIKIIRLSVVQRTFLLLADRQPLPITHSSSLAKIRGSGSKARGIAAIRPNSHSSLNV
eukprot:scaffold7692_cov163-Amphora_coffeaeformis.AAC.2